MGKLNVKGSAEMEFAVDIFGIAIKIHSKATSSGEVILSGKKKTEQFLRLMNDELNIEPSSFQLKSDYVSSDHEYYNYTKEIKLLINSDLSVLSRITTLLEELSDVTYDVDFYFSDEISKEKQVINDAINNSREKAEIIASSLGKKIIGVDEVNYELPSGVRRNLAKSICVEDYPNLESMLKNPTKTIAKSVYINWIIE
jgi:uncharacterized protein YggE